MKLHKRYLLFLIFAVPLCAQQGLVFYPVTPCRIVDTRASQGFTGLFGPPSLAANTPRAFPISEQSRCSGIPSAAAYSLNVTAVPFGYDVNLLSAWASGTSDPGFSTLYAKTPYPTAIAAIVASNATNNGQIIVESASATDLLIDIDGYFGLPGGPNALAFYALPPCRVADTRYGHGFGGAFGPPALTAYVGRDFPIQLSNCGVPSTATAYSFNYTVVPPGQLDFLSAWPSGQPYPSVSTLNDTQGTTVANAAITVAGAPNGSVRLTAGQTTDAIIDINGYFAPPGGAGALYFYPVAPCRVADTRQSGGALQPYVGRTFTVAGVCGVPNATLAKAYSLSVTEIPYAAGAFLLIWPSSQPYPGVSTLNSDSGATVANAAMVPAGTQGAVTVAVDVISDVLLDVNGFFSPNSSGTSSTTPDFSLYAPSEAEYTARPGISTTAAPITVINLNGFNSPVSFSCLSCPQGLSASFSPQSSTTGTNLTVTVAAGTAAQNYQLQIAGTAAGLTHTAVVNVSVQNLMAGISGVNPTQLEVNLGPLALDVYQSVNSSAVVPTNWCPATEVIRTCYYNLLQAYHNQGVSGVRFQFALAGGDPHSLSTPFTDMTSGNLSQSWLQSLSAFYQDVAAAGIRNVTPSPVTVDTWTWNTGTFGALPLVSHLTRDASCPAYDARAGGCPHCYDPAPDTLLFFPWLPFGLERIDSVSTTYWPDGIGQNVCYAKGSANPRFWSWSPLKNLLTSVVSGATAAGLTVEEVDLQNEASLFNFPVMGRLVYDNITNTKVFDYMALAAPLTMSASARYPLGPQQHCGSIYGDAASVMDLTELIGAVTGYPFGQPANFTYNGTMPCANDTNYTDDTKDLPRAPVQGLPPVLDMHTTPGCYNQNTNGACDQSSASLETSQAQYFFNDFWSFMMNHGITGYLAMFGELPNNQGCDFQTAQDASTATAGYLLSSLFTNASSHTVLRPWENSTNSCYAMPATIGSPTGPYAR